MGGIQYADTPVYVWILFRLTVPLLLRPLPDKALKVLRKTQCQSGLILAERHPLQGELADTMARAYATLGENKNA